MKVPFTGLEVQKDRLRHQIDARISKVLDHGKFIMGPEVGEFEAELSKFCGAQHSIGVANGTDALQIALMALGIEAGDRVFVPSFTYTATAEVILVLGGVPVFVDVDPVTFNIDADDLVEKISQVKASGHRALCVIGVDLFGLPADWEAINAICAEHGLASIADSAQSFGAALADGRSVGTLAQITTTSFFPAKPLGCYGDGGAIFSQDEDLAAVMRSIRVHGSGQQKYETVRVGMNSRLDTLQAAVLLSKIEVFGEEIRRRNELADYYSAALGDVCEVPQKPAGVTSAWAQYTIRSSERDALQQHLNNEGIPTAIYYPLPMHLQKAYAQFGDGEGSLMQSENASREVLSLPMNPYWATQEADMVIAAVKSFLA
ncbi:dTDP-4-amino-4,6-dideoxygalactose transaminase [Altererythrobacter xiamenensis]|uniref:dTDP-4-amino-4,6-dideoxygalactose transaminase n=1 Tax=Altererythrobacter xiamenensis TaxID=1316679 RepID=A0A1Y6F9L2_9SPHN|nr:DegT/DnrJ/EryC1/StrS aminotransferase family protein [Altererythrobacter xiamenensis]SMQ69063.1 dTDP-4-amino-4,6-dideoxygalactose transaminase [Altererythrobacter xiamenensis]